MPTYLYETKIFLNNKSLIVFDRSLSGVFDPLAAFYEIPGRKGGAGADLFFCTGHHTNTF
jgi:hypothetical protein